MAATSKPKLSKNLLRMKFMQRGLDAETKKQLEEEEKKIISEEHWYLDLPELKEKESFIIEEQSFMLCEDLLYGRMSFRGFNPEIEKLMVQMNSKNKDEEVEDVSMEADVSDEEMARRYESLVGTIGKKFAKKRDRAQYDEDENVSRRRAGDVRSPVGPVGSGKLEEAATIEVSCGLSWPLTSGARTGTEIKVKQDQELARRRNQEEMTKEETNGSHSETPETTQRVDNQEEQKTATKTKRPRRHRGKRKNATARAIQRMIKKNNEEERRRIGGCIVSSEFGPQCYRGNTDT